jgi:spore germination protein YaaH
MSEKSCLTLKKKIGRYKEVFRSRKSNKDRQYHGKIKDKITTMNYTENVRLSNVNPTKTWNEY